MEDIKIIKQRIHAYWIIGVLVFIVICLIAYIILGKTLCAKIITDYVSAFSTLLSIFLSIFAIFFTFHATQDTNRHIDTLSDRLWSQVQNSGNRNDENSPTDNLPENKVFRS